MDHAELMGSKEQDFYHLIENNPSKAMFEHSIKRMLDDNWKQEGRKLARKLGLVEKFKKYASE